MKNIMLSIRPEWLQKILSGQKTVELRLSRPNLTPPFMVFLYCSCKGTKKRGLYGQQRAASILCQRTTWKLHPSGETV